MGFLSQTHFPDSRVIKDENDLFRLDYVTAMKKDLKALLATSSLLVMLKGCWFIQTL
jgi:hypothetical protein